MHELYNAKYVAEYLENYVGELVYEDQSLRDRIRFDFTVATVEKVSGKWAFTGHDNKTKAAFAFHASKVMVANNLTSKPHMAIFPGQDNYQGQLFHQKDFGQSSMLTSSDRHITVLGRGKSAADMVYPCVKAEKSVTWVIISSGSGLAAFLSSEGKGRYKNSVELGFTRVMGTFNPSPFTLPPGLVDQVPSPKNAG